MNIVGEGLPSSIGNQIRKRQEIYGSINRTTEEILYLNSRTAFVKAVSSVDVTNYDTDSIRANRPELASILSQYGGDLLARNFILFNGTSGGNNTRRAGIPTELLAEPFRYVNDFAYGLGGLEFGIRPMPGIISMQTTSKGTYGSVEETLLRIKAWNRIQFEIIDILYLRLGYSVLIEWGNTSYFDNNGVYIPENQYTLESEFLAGNLTPNSIYAFIEQYKLESNGNYDAIYGIVTNFDWTFGEDGSYDITVKLISKGDIVESIKSAVLVSETTNTEEPKAITPEELKQATLQSNENSKELQKYLGNGLSLETAQLMVNAKKLKFNNNQQSSTTTTSITPSTSAEAPDPIVAIKDAHTLGRLYYNVQQILDNGFSNSNVSNSIPYASGVYTSPDSSDVKPYFYQTYKTPTDTNNTQGNDNSTKYYIRFGSLLAFIQTNLVPKEKQGNTLYPSINIDYNVNNNLAYTNDFQISVDPSICLISTSVKSKDGNQEFYFARNGSPYKKTIAGTQVGQIMNIYINFDTIIEIIGDNGDPKNQTSIYTLLEVLCNKISIALGGINTFRPFIDTSTNTLKIIDESVLPNRNGVSTALGGLSNENDPTIQIYGYDYRRNPETNQITQGYAGFVKNFKFTSKLDPKFAQIISIGATSQGGIIGEDATAFSSLNKGLKDRIKPEIFASTGTSTNSEINIETKTRVDQFKESLTNFENYIGQIGVESKRPTAPILNEAETSSYTNLYATFMQFIETKNAVSAKKSSGTMGFIPVSVGLTLDGISGLKLLNGIKVDTSYLPSNYPETMLFIISKLAHKVENNIWTTELETIMTPKDIVSSVSGSLNGETSRRTSSGNSGSSNSGGSGSGSGNITSRDETTLTTNLPLASKIYSKAESVKTQIYLHHTAGHQKGDKGESTMADWNKRESNLASTHAIIDRNGFVQFVFSEKYKAFAQGVEGSKVSYNKLGVSVEIMALGYKRSGVSLQSYETTPGWVKSVGFDLKPKAWRGHAEWQGYTQEQVNSTIKLIKYWSDMFGIEIPPFTQTVFNNMFPEKGKTSPNATSGKSGLYTHGSVCGKVDINPDPLLIKALKTEFANGYNIGGATKTLKYTQPGFIL